MTAIEVAISRKSFRGQHGASTVLEDLRFRVEAGEFVCILGPSGCGKTTLLHILAGLDSDFEGEVRFHGDARPRQGVMFQTPRLMPWLSLRENLDLVAVSSARSDGRPAALLREMGLDGFADAMPGKVSGGMQRRAALARACVNPCDLLLLDEPLVSLDAPTAASLRSWLSAEWRRTGQTVVCLTHDLREALVLADRVLFLSPRPGRVVLDERVTLTRPRDIDGADVAGQRGRLLDAWPALLSGATSGGA
jgi:ABC-type nitrate/sulfonate/bicarbonate transport system ATPase subunit